MQSFLLLWTPAWTSEVVLFLLWASPSEGLSWVGPDNTAALPAAGQMNGSVLEPWACGTPSGSTARAHQTLHSSFRAMQAFRILLQTVLQLATCSPWSLACQRKQLSSLSYSSSFILQSGKLRLREGKALPCPRPHRWVKVRGRTRIQSPWLWN